MRKLFIVTLAVWLAFAGSQGMVLASNDAPADAILLSPDEPARDSLLVGDTGGAVLFYRIDYAGNGMPVLIRVAASPSRAITGPRFGFKLYGPAGLVGEANEEYHNDTTTGLAFTLASVTPGEYLVQVYNFTAGIPVAFHLEASDLAGAVLPAPNTIGAMSAMADNTSPGRALAVPWPAASVVGTLGNDGDAGFQYFTAEHPGMNQPLSIALGYSPASPHQNGAVGFDVLDSAGKRVAQGAEVDRDQFSAVVSAQVALESPDTITIQLVNYEPGLTVNYTLGINGSAGRVADVAGNQNAEGAAALSATEAAKQGTLVANQQEGSLNFYRVSYPGGNRPLRIGIATDEVGGYTDSAIGLKLYQGADEIAVATSHLDSAGRKRIASVLVSQGQAAEFLVQVFNWTRGLPVRYAIYATGL